MYCTSVFTMQFLLSHFVLYCAEIMGTCIVLYIYMTMRKSSRNAKHSVTMILMKKTKKKLNRSSFRDRSENCKRMRRKPSERSQTPWSGFPKSKSRAKSLWANYRKSDPGLHRLCQDLLLADLQSDSSQMNRSPHQFLLEDNSRRAYCIYYCTVTNVTSKYCTSTHKAFFIYAFFSRAKKIIPMAEILSELKKGDAGY